MMVPGDYTSVCNFSPNLPLKAGSWHTSPLLGAEIGAQQVKAWSVSGCSVCRRTNSNGFIRWVCDYSKQSVFLRWGPSLRRIEPLKYETLGNSLTAVLVSVGPSTWREWVSTFQFTFSLWTWNQSVVGGITTFHMDLSHLNDYWLKQPKTFANTFNMNRAQFLCYFFPQEVLKITFRTFELCEAWAWKETVLFFFSGEICNTLNKLPRELLQKILSSSWKAPLTQSEKILIPYIMVFSQRILLILTHNKQFVYVDNWLLNWWAICFPFFLKPPPHFKCPRCPPW